MEEEEIELWYEDEKQKLSERYIKCIEKGMGVEERARKFDKAMEVLDRKYKAKHSALMGQKESQKRNREIANAMRSPFKFLIYGIWHSFGFIFSYVKASFAALFGDLHFAFGLLWTRHSYKLPDGLARFFRPMYFFYVKHLKVPLIIMGKPFAAAGRFLKRTLASIVEGLSKFGAFLWKYVAIGAKKTFVSLSALNKGLSGKFAEMSKRYHEAYTVRLQKTLERKQARKEARDKRHKEKDAKKGIAEDATPNPEGSVKEAVGA